MSPITFGAARQIIIPMHCERDTITGWLYCSTVADDSYDKWRCRHPVSNKLAGAVYPEKPNTVGVPPEPLPADPNDRTSRLCHQVAIAVAHRGVPCFHTCCSSCYISDFLDAPGRAAIARLNNRCIDSGYQMSE